MPGVSSPSAGSHCVARTTHSSHGLTPELPRNVLRPEKHDTHTKISVNLDTQIHIWIPLLDESMFSAALPLCPWLAAQPHTHLAAVCRAPARAAGPAAAPCKSSPGDGHPWRFFGPVTPMNSFFLFPLELLRVKQPSPVCRHKLSWSIPLPLLLGLPGVLQAFLTSEVLLLL